MSVDITRVFKLSNKLSTVRYAGWEELRVLLVYLMLLSHVLWSVCMCCDPVTGRWPTCL